METIGRVELQGLRFWVVDEGLGLEAWGFRISDQGLAFLIWAWVLGFRLRVQGLGFKMSL